MKIILILTALMMVGCSTFPFPSTTSFSANSKLNNIDNPNLKVQQNFKWEDTE